MGFLYAGVAREKFAGKPRAFVTADEWLEEKRKKDGAEGLWRIHDRLYDLGEWIEKHPGGKHWLDSTKGTDITEAFECHHVSRKAENLLNLFYKREAKTERNSLITFCENGFYKTLKRKIVERKLLEYSSTKPHQKSKVLADSLAVGVFVTGLLGTFWTRWLLLISGTLLGMLAVCAHNFFHMSDNWRMHYFHLSLMSLREWRISHVLSHHLHPNTSWDLEIRMVQPVWNFFPEPDKKFGWLSWPISPLLMASLIHVQLFRRILRTFLSTTGKCHKEEMVGLFFPLFLFLLSGQSFWTTFVAWNAIIATASLTFAFIGFTAAHHHPDIYHDGDFFGTNRDFGIVQLAAVRNRKNTDGNFFFTMVSFGNHALHHLFPTVDHSKLPDLNSVLQETCEDFNIQFEPFTPQSLIIGMYRQLARNYTNSTLKILKEDRQDKEIE